MIGCGLHHRPAEQEPVLWRWPTEIEAWVVVLVSE
jgi:hypothetical protein